MRTWWVFRLRLLSVCVWSRKRALNITLDYMSMGTCCREKFTLALAHFTQSIHIWCASGTYRRGCAPVLCLKTPEACVRDEKRPPAWPAQRLTAPGPFSAACHAQSGDELSAQWHVKYGSEIFHVLSEITRSMGAGQLSDPLNRQLRQDLGNIKFGNAPKRIVASLTSIKGASLII